MNANAEEMELKERLNLIETMIAEGRRTTESWGWVFVLWGVAYYVAIAWANWGNAALAWPVTMIAASILTGAIAARRAGKRPATTMGRAIAAIWVALGISMFLLFMALGVSGKLADVQVFVAVAAAMLGMANAASSLILKWKLQFACAVVWWAAAVASCFVSAEQGMAVFLTAIFLCQIVFGVYGMMREARQRTMRGASHA